MNEFALLKNLLAKAQNLQLFNDAELDDIKRKGKMALENVFPWKTYSTDIKYIQFKQIHYSPTAYQINQDWKDGQNKLINLIDTAIKDYEIRLSKKEIKPSPVQPKIVIQEKTITVIDQSAIREIKQQFLEYRQTIRKWGCFALSLILSTIGLWVFYNFSNWNWFNNHPKKLSIALMFNLAIMLLLLNIPIKRRWEIWVTTTCAIIATLFTII